MEAKDAGSSCEEPLNLSAERLDERIIERLGLVCGELDLPEWANFVVRSQSIDKEIDIALVGKYVALPDAYLSVTEALHHSGIYHDRRVKIHWLDAESLSPEEVGQTLARFDGILVPGGFGIRGIEGKIRAAYVARSIGMPYLGICLGMQVAVAEFARNVARLSGANSSEFDPVTEHPVIDLMPDQREVKNLGGTMRLGTYPCAIAPDTLAAQAYGEKLIYERHRHRYEFNNAYRDRLASVGLVISGLSPDGRLVEMIELSGHPWFVGAQGHPEFKSRPSRPAPLFREFVGAAVRHRDSREG